MTFIYIILIAVLTVMLILTLKSNSTHKQAYNNIKYMLDDLCANMDAKQAYIDRIQAELNAYKSIKVDKMISADEHEKQIIAVQSELSQTKKDLETYTNKFTKLDGKLRSERTRLGQVTENIIPFLDKFPYNPKSVRGLFNPIDLIAFDDKEVVFIEVKSGDSKLSQKQKAIKDLIDSGKVRFEVHRIDDKGYEIE